MFKVGDKVKIVKRCKGSVDEFCHKHELGDEGVIISIEPGYHKFQVKEIGSPYAWWCAEDEIVLVSTKFKVGDKVRIINRTNHFLRVGSIGEIVGIISSSKYEIKGQNNLGDWIVQYVAEDDLFADSFKDTCIKTTPTKQPNMLTKLTPRQEKLDDKVKALIELGVINSSLELVDKEFVLNFLFDKFYDELGKTAMERVKQIKKEMKKDK